MAGMGTTAQLAKRWLEEFAQANSSSRLKLLDLIAPEIVRVVSESGWNLYFRESNPAVKAALVRTFAMHWNADHIDDILMTIAQMPNAVRTSVFEILAAHSPHVLIPELSRFLLDSDHHIRILAIRSLARIDPPAAVEHLEEMLRNGPPAHRRKAMEDVIHFPWELAGPVLLRFIAIENDPELLAMACLHFQINPDTSSPYRLMELMIDVPPVKRGRLDATVQAIIESLQQGVLPPGEFDRFQRDLEKWARLRSAKRFVSSLVDRLAHIDATGLAGLEPGIQHRMADEQVFEQLRESLSWSVPERVKERVRWLLERKGRGGETSLRSTGRKPEPETSTSDERARSILTMDGKEFGARLDEFEKALEDRLVPPVIKAAVLRRSIGAKIDRFLRFAERWADRGDATMLENTSLEYLEAFEQSFGFAALGHLLERILLSDAPASKKAISVRILRKRHPKEALELVLRMLASDQTTRQATALSCLVFFDFPLYRRRLTEFLGGTTDASLFNSGLCLFEANPDPESLLPLFGLRKGLSGDAAKEVGRVMEATDRMLTEMFQTRTALDADGLKHLGRRWEEEERRHRKAVPAYALSALKRKEQTGPVEDDEGFLRRLFSGFGF